MNNQDQRPAILAKAFKDTVHMWEGAAAYLIPNSLFDEAGKRAAEALDAAKQKGHVG